jgi:hypothetical protein
VLAERAYVAGGRHGKLPCGLRNLPLYSLESKHSAGRLQHHRLLTSLRDAVYTNTLNALDLAGIPFFAGQNVNAQHPLVIAGGHCHLQP